MSDLQQRIDKLENRLAAAENRERRLLEAIDRLADTAIKHAGEGIELDTWKAFAKSIRAIDPDGDDI